MTKKQFLSFSLLLFGVSLIVFFIHHLMVQALGNHVVFFYDVWKIYVFHFAVTLFLFFLLFLVSGTLPDYIGYTFMGFILLKFALAIAFLLPLIRMEQGSKIPDFFSFFVPYFIFLFIEILLTMKILKLSAGKFTNKNDIQKNNKA